MYQVVYAFFYLLSLLPWRVLYLVSDGLYVLVYYVMGYRKKVVMSNLAIAFPEKTVEERTRIAKDFYHQFIDSFIEIIKLIRFNKQQLAKRMTSNIEVMNALYPSGQSVVIATGHFFNWELANLTVSAFGKFPFIGIYMQLSNKTFDKLVRTIRGKFGSILISVNDFRSEYTKYGQQQHAIGLVADQNPTNPANGYWYPFFGKLAPFAKGPERTAKKLNAAVVMVNFYRKRRGYYHMQFEVLTTTPKATSEGEITRTLVHYVEDCIRQHPSNYLWSHRRWKHRFDEDRFGHLRV